MRVWKCCYRRRTQIFNGNDVITKWIYCYIKKCVSCVCGNADRSTCNVLKSATECVCGNAATGDALKSAAEMTSTQMAIIQYLEMCVIRVCKCCYRRCTQVCNGNDVITYGYIAIFRNMCHACVEMQLQATHSSQQ